MFGKKKKNKAEESASSTEAENTTETVEVADTAEAPEDVLAATAEAIDAASGTMTVPAEDMEILNRFRKAGDDCVTELGNIEIRKARIIASYGQLEQASQSKLMEIGRALGIAEGTGWSVNPDGTVTVHSEAATTATGEVTTSAE